MVSGNGRVLNSSRNSLIPTLGGCERSSGCSSSSEVERRMLLLWAVSWNHTYPWHLCNRWIINDHQGHQKSNQCTEVAAACGETLWILWIELPWDQVARMDWNIHLMSHNSQIWIQVALVQNYLLFAIYPPPGDQISKSPWWCWENWEANCFKFI